MRLSSQNCVVAVLAFLALGGSAYPVKAQGLGDVARKEEERRKDIKAPAKVYTNKDLGSVPDAPSGTFSSPTASGSASTEAPKDTTSAKSDDGKDKGGSHTRTRPTGAAGKRTSRRSSIATRRWLTPCKAASTPSTRTSSTATTPSSAPASTATARRPTASSIGSRRASRTARRHSPISTKKPARLASRLAGCGDPAPARSGSADSSGGGQGLAARDASPCARGPGASRHRGARPA